MPLYFNHKYISDKVTIEVVRNTPYYAQSPFGYDSMEYKQLSDVHGYAEVDYCTFSSTATSDEKDKITSLLKSGVFLPE